MALVLVRYVPLEVPVGHIGVDKEGWQAWVGVGGKHGENVLVDETVQKRSL